MKQKCLILPIVIGILLITGSGTAFAITEHQHPTEERERIEPTCKVGYEAGIYCETCNEYIEGGKEIPAIEEHQYFYIPEKASTCKYQGNKLGWICTKCGSISVEFIPLDKSNHDPNSIMTLEAKKATCIETGLTEGKKCKDCGTIIVKQGTIPLLAHADGNKDGKCDVCTYSMSSTGEGTGNGSGNSSGDGSGQGTGNGSGNSSGNGTGDGTGNGPDNETGDDTGNGTGNGPDNETGDGTGNGTGNGPDNETGDDIGNGTSDGTDNSTSTDSKIPNTGSGTIIVAVTAFIALATLGAIKIKKYKDI